MLTGDSSSYVDGAFLQRIDGEQRGDEDTVEQANRRRTVRMDVQVEEEEVPDDQRGRYGADQEAGEKR